MVLILSAIMFLFASTLLLFTMTEVHISDFEQRSIQAFYAAESSVTLGLAKLRTNTDYRTDTNDTISIGGNTGLLNVQFYDGTHDNNGHYRKALAPSLYRLALRGQGSVPGLNAAARRTVERDILVKPFVLFARNTVTLSGGCNIKGNIHGNSSVVIDSGDVVTGNVTSNGPVTNNGSVTGTVSSLEPEIIVSPLPIDLYFPKYHYKGKEYKAKPLVHDTVTLSPVSGVDPPAPSIEVYSGFPTTDNPAGVFYPDTEIIGPLTALQVKGTVVIPPAYPKNTVLINGVLTITPVDNFPALICEKDLDIRLIGNLEKFLKSLKKNRIIGLISVKEDVSLSGTDTPGDIIQGSIFGNCIIVTANPTLQVTYNPAIISDPPPGIDLIEIGEWREIFE